MSETNVTLVATGTPNPVAWAEMKQYRGAAGPILAMTFPAYLRDIALLISGPPNSSADDLPSLTENTELSSFQIRFCSIHRCGKSRIHTNYVQNWL